MPMLLRGQKYYKDNAANPGEYGCTKYMAWQVYKEMQS